MTGKSSRTPDAPLDTTNESTPDPADNSAAKAGEAQRAEADATRNVDTSIFKADVVGVEDGVPSDSYDLRDGNVMVELKRDLVEEFYYPDTTRPSYRILHTKGQMVSKAVIDAYDAAAANVVRLRKTDGVDPENPAGIDSTTLASGTKVGYQIHAEASK